MTEENKVSSGDELSSSGAAEESQESKVNYDTYRKTVNAEKNAKDEARKLQDELARYRENEMRQKGEFEKLAQAAKRDKERAESELKKLQAKIQAKNYFGSVRDVALEMGVRAEAFTEFFKAEASDWDVEIDEDGYASGEQVKAKISDIQSKKDWWFGKKATKPINTQAVFGGQEAVKQKSLSEMTTAEIIELGKGMKG